MVEKVDITSDKYPLLLRKIPNPPKELYFKSSLGASLSVEDCLAVVGSRKMSLYGRRVINHIFSTLSKKITIVSGFMYGVDVCSHEAALRHNLKTVAVMPCGIDYIHPEDQKNLYNSILSSGGLILSEYPADFKPKLWTYPKRNRIVAGLSKATLVIEAGANSGSLITAELANSYGREVFVVPGSIFSDLSTGKTHISNLFANSISSGCEINKFFGLEVSVVDNSEYKCNSIITLLNASPLTAGEISEALCKPISQVNGELTELGLQGLVSEESGRFYAC